MLQETLNTRSCIASLLNSVICSQTCRNQRCWIKRTWRARRWLSRRCGLTWKWSGTPPWSSHPRVFIKQDWWQILFNMLFSFPSWSAISGSTFPWTTWRPRSTTSSTTGSFSSRRSLIRPTKRTLGRIRTMCGTRCRTVGSGSRSTGIKRFMFRVPGREE